MRESAVLANRDVYDEEHHIFRDAVRKFFQAEATPYGKEWNAAGQVPRAFWDKLGDNGLLCPQLPEEYGGVGGNYRLNCVINEEQVYNRAGGAGIAVLSQRPMAVAADAPSWTTFQPRRSDQFPWRIDRSR